MRYWIDMPGQHQRVHKRERICPVSGAGSLSESARKRRAREIVQRSGADTVEHFQKAVLSEIGITFRQQSETWFAYMENPRRANGKSGLPTAASTLATWSGIVRKLNDALGDLPLCALVQNQQPVADFITKMVEDGYLPKTIRNYVQLIKMIVASAKDKATRKQLFPVAWDQEVLLVPAVRKQNQPVFTAAEIVKIVCHATGQYRTMFIVLAASGLRISELLGLRIENVLDDCYRLRIVEKNYNGRQEDRLKTPAGERTVELHSSIATMLRMHIGARTSGWVFETKKHKPHSASNILKRYLHPILVGDSETPGVTGKKAGEHAFRRYRNGYLRRMSCPVGLLKYWMAHSRKTDMSDVYDKSPEDEAWRLEEAERLGIGFELPENVPSCTECTEKTKTATELVAV